LLAAHLLAPRLAQRAPFFWSCPMHDPEDTPLELCRATFYPC